IESLVCTRESSYMFDRPSTNRGRILGGDRLNKVPDSCVIDVDIRYLPGQDPAAIRAQVSELADVDALAPLNRAPAIGERSNVFVSVLSECASQLLETETLSVGRD